jgi:hypothetical protein
MDAYGCSKPNTTNDDLASWWRSMKIGLKRLPTRKGPLAIGIKRRGLVTRVMPQTVSPDIQFHFATLSACFLKGVVPQWELTDIDKGMLQFMGLRLRGLVLIIVFRQIALWLPHYIDGK